MTTLQAMALVPAAAVVAVAPGHVPTDAALSPTAAVIRPEPVPTFAPRDVTEPGNVHPVPAAVLSDQ